MTSVSTETMPMVSATSALSRGRSGASSASHSVVDDDDAMALAPLVTKPFKIVDVQRELRMGLTAASLDELEDRAKAKFRIPVSLPIRIVLEVDGTEIDDNDYFGTLDPDTSLMILCDDERWTPYKSNFILGLAVEADEKGSASTPGSPVEELVWRLHQDLSFFPWLTPKELETIAQMDKDEMKKVVPDVRFLEFLQDLSEKYLQEKDKYGGETTLAASSSSGGSSSSMASAGTGAGDNGASKQPNGTTILHDPIKLIRMYSKSKHFKHSHYEAPPPQQSQRAN
ncbi:unnamed protein product [Orchesella dallaii]|uniref:CIDE-N domain-containing protein n=1 Tax=Orchesella dallaii TaxID=48710 RepID=A0ABP1QN97_9HEXA